MNKIKFFFKKYWIFIFLATIAMVFSLSYLKNKTSVLEKKLLLSTPKIESYKTPAVINYSPIENKLGDLEKESEVFQISPVIYSNQEVVEIAQKFEFKNPPLVSYDQQNNGNVYSWDDEEKSLEINLGLDEIIYHSEFSSSLLGNLNGLSFDEAEKIAYEFFSMNNFLPPEGISLKRKVISYIKITENGIKEVNSESEANFIKIGFSYYLNEKEIIGPFISLTINGDKQVTNFNYQASFKQVNFLDKYPLKTAEEIKQKLKTINAISYFYLTDSYGPTEEQALNITNIYFNNISLVYYKNIYTQSYLQPIFFISGQATLNNGRTAEVGLYLPAIKEEYLLK